MKLLNQSLAYLTVSIFVIVSIWAVVFYFNMLDEIHDSIDDGLDNYRLLILQKAQKDTLVLRKHAFDESNYAIQEIPKPAALQIRDTHKDTLMYMLNEEKLEPVRMLTTAFELDKRYYKLRVISSMVEEDDQISNLLWSTVWLFIILVVSIIVINNLVLRKLWKPFYRLLQQLKAFRIDKNTGIPPIQTTTKEFVELKQACDILIAHTLKSYNLQKQFTENAAHELQTPLAIITNKLELLLEEKQLEDENAEVITQILQATARLKQFNKSLLLLSKIENKQFFDNQLISINQLVQKTAGDLEEFAQFKNITLAIEQTDSVEVEMDAHLASILVSNLVKNAIFHNVEHGKVSVNLSHSALSICNTSQSGELDEKVIFQRFFNNSEPQKGTGLGLAIVHAICKLYGFGISYSYPGRHCFEIRFS